MCPRIRTRPAASARRLRRRRPCHRRIRCRWPGCRGTADLGSYRRRRPRDLRRHAVRPERGALQAPGDIFTACQGCDHTLAAYRSKFANETNFRGFPRVPTPEVAFERKESEASYRPSSALLRPSEGPAGGSIAFE
ncbi:phage BR0599 family protein [Methylobacterium sp. CM6257]